MIDIFSYLTGATNIQLDGSRLDPVIHKSKREGFIELTGSLKGITDNGSEIYLQDYQGADVPYVIQILNKESNFIIMENQGRALKSLKTNNWLWQEIPVSFLFQSQLTHLVVQQILDTQNCALASIEEAYRLHKGMLEEFTQHLQRVTGKKYDRCPIT